MTAALLSGTTAVAIGTSAGGVEALSVILPALPAGCLAPVFVVIHQPRHWPSLLVDIFQPRCAVPIREAEDKEPVVPGTVYFAPPDYHMLVDRTSTGVHVSLSADAPVHYSRPSVDVLFEAAADVYGPRLLGMVLTGASPDGAAGLAAIHRAGGRTMVQSPGTAQVPLMVEAALRSCPVDHVLTLDEIAGMLATLEQGQVR